LDHFAAARFGGHPLRSALRWAGCGRERACFCGLRRVATAGVTSSHWLAQRNLLRRRRLPSLNGGAWGGSLDMFGGDGGIRRVTA